MAIIGVDLELLQDIAADIQKHVSLNRREGITDENALDVQALCLAEEAGEVVGAYRRYAKKARRTGTLAEVRDEIADVIIVTAIFAEMLDLDLTDAVNRKLQVIYSRGWRQDAA